MPHSNRHPEAHGPDLVHLEKSWTRAAGGCVNFKTSSGHQKQWISRAPCTHVVKFWIPRLIHSLSREHDVGMYNNVLCRWNDASSTIPPSSELSEASDEGGATSLGIAASMESPAFEASWVPESVVPNPPEFGVATSARTNYCKEYGFFGDESSEGEDLMLPSTNDSKPQRDGWLPLATSDLLLSQTKTVC